MRGRLTITIRAIYDASHLRGDEPKGFLMIAARHRKASCLLMLAAIALSSAVAALAHHSFSMFDQTKQVTLTGTVTEFQWTNPHAYIEIDVTDEKGGVRHWSVEMGSPSILMQSGWKFKDVKPKDKITVRLSPLREIGR